MYSMLFCEFVFLLLSYCRSMAVVAEVKDAGEYSPLPKCAPRARANKARPHPVGRREQMLSWRHNAYRRGKCHTGCEWCADSYQHLYRKAKAAWKEDLRDWLDHDDRMDAMLANEPDALEFLDELDEEYANWDAERWTQISEFSPGPDSHEYYWRILTADDVCYAVYYGMDFQKASWQVTQHCVHWVKRWFNHRDPANVGKALAEVEKVYQLRQLYYSFS